MLTMFCFSYFLTTASFQALYGKLSDIFGRKPALLFAYAVFAIGSLFCGLARNIDELVAARVSRELYCPWSDPQLTFQAFAGIGGGGMTTVVSIMMSDIVPLRERGTWQGILNIVYASGAACGAPLGKISSLFSQEQAVMKDVQVAYSQTLLAGDGGKRHILRPYLKLAN